MAFFDQFPYTNFHELNLDWFLNKFRELEKRVEDVPTEGGLNEVRAQIEDLETQLDDRINNLTASDVGALPASVTKLPNPEALTFTGAVVGSYNGSGAVSVHIPQGSGGGGGEPLTFTGAVDATYDGSSPVSVEIPEKSATPNVLTFTGGATGTFDGSAPLSINIPTGGGGGVDNQPLVFSGAVSATYDGSTQVNVEVPTVPAALPNPQALTFSGAVDAVYDGSQALNVIIPEPGEPVEGVYRFAGLYRVRTAANQTAGEVLLETDTPLCIINDDLLVVTYLSRNTSSYGTYAPYSAVIPVGVGYRTPIAVLTAINVAPLSAQIFSRKVRISRPESTVLKLEYQDGYKATLWSSEATSTGVVVDNEAIGINSITVLRRHAY